MRGLRGCDQVRRRAARAAWLQPPSPARQDDSGVTRYIRREVRARDGQVMIEVHTGLQNFLLALSALFSIVNPPAAALIFAQVTADRSHEERLVLARQIGVYATLVMLCSLWGGAYVLNFFGVTLPALRIAGGLVVASRAWVMLAAEESSRARKHGQASRATGEPDVAFFPLTMPFTTGPGTIAVAIALGSSLPVGTTHMAAYVLGASLAAVVIAVMIWISYAFADRLTDILGEHGAQVLTRLSAFLLLCIGVQITLSGVLDAARTILDGAHAS